MILYVGLVAILTAAFMWADQMEMRKEGAAGRYPATPQQPKGKQL